MTASIRSLMPAAVVTLGFGIAACAPSLADDLRRLTPVSPSPALSTTDSLVKLTLERTIVDRCKHGRGCPPFPLLASSGLSAASIPSSETVVFVLVTREELQVLADRHDVVWYYYIYKVEILADSAQVLLGHTLLTGVHAPGGVDLGSSMCNWAFRRVESQWVIVGRALCLTA